MIDSVKECCIFSQFTHPNICRVLIPGNFPVRLESGIPLRSAFNQLPVRDILTDIVSAVSYLHLNNICCVNLNLDDLVVSEGRVKISRLRDAKFVDNYAFPDPPYLMTGGFYKTKEQYQNLDPEFAPRTLISIKTDLYSIARIIYLVSGGSDQEKYYYDTEDFRKLGVTDSALLDFLEMLQAPLSERRELAQLLDKPALIKNRLHPSSYHRDNLIPEEYDVVDIFRKFPQIQDVIKINFDSIIYIAYQRNLKIKVVYLALDMFLRYLANTNSVDFNSDDLSISVIQLASEIYDKEITDDFLRALEINFNSEFRKNVIETLRGKLFSLNPYHALSCCSGVVNYLHFMRDINYSNYKYYEFDECDQLMKRKDMIKMCQIYQEYLSSDGLLPERVGPYITDYSHDDRNLFLMPHTQQLEIENVLGNINLEEPLQKYVKLIVTYREYLDHINFIKYDELLEKLAGYSLETDSISLISRIIDVEKLCKDILRLKSEKVKPKKAVPKKDFDPIRRYNNLMVSTIINSIRRYK